MNSMGRDLKSNVFCVHGFPVRSAADLVAGGPGDGLEIMGFEFDLSKLPGRFNGLLYVLGAAAALGAAETFRLINCRVEHSDDLVSWPVLAQYGVTLTLTGGVSAFGSGLMQVDLANAKRYVRAIATPKFSALAADTAELSGEAVFCGADVRPDASEFGLPI